MTRIFNFSLVRPFSARSARRAQRNLLEAPRRRHVDPRISHRSKTFDDIIQGCEADMRTLAGSGRLQDPLPAGREPAVLDGPDNLRRPAAPPTTSSPACGAKAVKETNESAREDCRHDRGRQLQERSKQQDLTLDPNAYVHMTRTTIYGPNGTGCRTGNVPLVSDMSSDISAVSRRRETRVDLRGRAKEPRARQRHSRSSARTC